MELLFKGIGENGCLFYVQKEGKIEHIRENQDARYINEHIAVEEIIEANNQI